MAHGTQCVEKRLSEPIGACTIVLQHMIGNALRRSRSNARKNSQRLDQPLKTASSGDTIPCHDLKKAA